MIPARPERGQSIVVLAGDGLSEASGIAPTGLCIRQPGSGYDEINTSEAWETEPDKVRKFFDARRTECANLLPDEGHIALARLQQRWGTERVILATVSVDGLIRVAGAPWVHELLGSLWTLQCSADRSHPLMGVFGPHKASASCRLCKNLLRPSIVRPDESPWSESEVMAEIDRCSTFLSVGTTNTGPSRPFIDRAIASKAHCIEVHPEPTPELYDTTIAGAIDQALPDLIARWLDE